MAQRNKGLRLHLISKFIAGVLQIPSMLSGSDFKPSNFFLGSSLGISSTSLESVYKKFVLLLICHQMVFTLE